MTKYTCTYCGKHLASKTSLNNHILGAKYCIEKRNKPDDTISPYQCDGCNKKFTLKQSRDRHILKCVLSIRKKCEETVLQLTDKYEQRIKELESKLENIALKAVSRPITVNQQNNKIQQINNFLPITDKHLQEHVSNLTIEHIKAGPSGYARYALDYPFKDRIVCSDFSRRKVKYKNEEGQIVTDPEMTTLSIKLFSAIKDKNAELIKEYSKGLQEKFWGIPNESENDLDEKEIEDLNGRMNEVSDVLFAIMSQDRQVRELAGGVKSELYHDFLRHVCSGCVM